MAAGVVNNTVGAAGFQGIVDRFVKRHAVVIVHVVVILEGQHHIHGVDAPITTWTDPHIPVGSPGAAVVIQFDDAIHTGQLHDRFQGIAVGAEIRLGGIEHAIVTQYWPQNLGVPAAERPNLDDAQIFF